MKILALDVDGTLLDLKGDPPDKGHFDVLYRYCLRKNFRVVLLTGRGINEIYDIPFLIETLKPIFISANGGIEIFKFQSNNYVSCKSFNDFVALQDNSEIIACEFLIKGFFPNIVMQEPHRQSKFKKSFYVNEANFSSLKEKRILLQKKFVNTELILSFNDIDIHYLDIQHKKMTKVGALNFISNALNVSFGDVIFFGDNGNDISCFINIQSAYLFSPFKESLEFFYEIKAKGRFLSDFPGPLAIVKKLNSLDTGSYE